MGARELLSSWTHCPESCSQIGALCCVPWARSFLSFYSSLPHGSSETREEARGELEVEDHCVIWMELRALEAQGLRSSGPQGVCELGCASNKDVVLVGWGCPEQSVYVPDRKPILQFNVPKVTWYVSHS